jgi:hypothetical protein
MDALANYQELGCRGVRTVLKKTPSGAQIYFVIRASHRMAEIEAAIEALSRAVTQYTKR